MALHEILAFERRLLTFRRVGPIEADRRSAFLAFGLFCTWLAGIGRYWDNPRASTWQALGLGSIGYVFVLAAILWIIVAPLRPKHWSYWNVLLFVTLTSPLALLYAIPVERFLSLDLAASVNAWFLAVVASWRLALLFVFLHRVAGLRAIEAIIAGLLPMTAIVVALTVLNLEHVVFDLMSGISEDARSPNDAAYEIVLGLGLTSLYAAPVLFLAHLTCIILRRRANPPASSHVRDPARAPSADCAHRADTVPGSTSASRTHSDR